MSVDISQFPLLALASTPEELRQLPTANLTELCDQLRAFLLKSVSRSSGHLASGLGTVELTVALHYVYNTPVDRIIWDVGHQAYPHKILTGRRDKMHTIRQKDGLHPFPNRNESEYDTFTVGHSGTSISAALGMAIAAEKEQENRKVVAVIGDGAITGGMAFEAMNHAGSLDKDMLIVLNDNEMSISENVGALNNHLAKLLTGPLYTSIREGGKKLLSGVPSIKELAKRSEEHLKGMVVPGTLFEEFGFNYIGPIDGHDVNALIGTLSNMRNLKGPQILHVMTKKGKGYTPAEQDPIGYHGVPKFDPNETTLPSSKGAITFSGVFGQWLCDMAGDDSKLMAITPAMREGSGMVEFSQRFPEQYFDAAIAEQHAITLGAGMACDGLKPVVAIYSTFLQRGYDQLIHDVAIPNLDVLFAIDRGGLVGADGETHQGAFDLSFLNCIPNMVVMAPSDENECRQMLYTGYHYQGPAAVRYPRGSACGATIEPVMTELEIGKAVLKRSSAAGKLAILNFGTLLPQAMDAAEQLDATVIDMRFIKPFDQAMVQQMANQHDVLVTLEENAIIGGAGSTISQYVMNNRLDAAVLNIGLPDHFIRQGTQLEQQHQLGLDCQGIVDKINQFINI
ncbi:MAG: 1-deoxy-D-xylulose-5-phosphate synthase [Gammaproteobacteria bacterium]|nr:1-deoxy-D-xylulose-5-phosphate synthase [Gammaproteobacteria bacterium]